MDFQRIKNRFTKKTKKHVVRLLGLRRHVYVRIQEELVCVENVIYLPNAAAKYVCVNCKDEKQLIGQQLSSVPFLEMHSCSGPKVKR